MSKRVLIIGGGHNGLTAAAVLAKAGHKVSVYEAHETLGGLARSREFHPGFHSVGLLHDTTGLHSKVVGKLGLEANGLILREPPAQYVSTTGGAVLLGKDGASGAVSEADQLAYADLQRFLRKLKKPLGGLLESLPPSPLGPLSALLRPALGVRGLGAKDMVELLRAPSMCVADWMRDIFESEELSAAVAHSALIGSFAGPWSPWTAANLLFDGASQGQEVVGGPAALIAALAKTCRDLGVEIRTASRVKSIELDSGTIVGLELVGGERVPADVVLATCDPKTTFLKLIGQRYLADGLSRSVANIRMRGMTAKLNVALQGELLAPGGTRVEVFRTGGSLDRLEQAYDAAKYREMSDDPMLDLRVFSGEGVSPAGDCVVSILVHYAPYKLSGGWTDDARAALEEKVVKALENEFPGTKERIQGTELIVPTDIEGDYLIEEGHVFHGEHAPDQQLFMRPTIDLANYATPIPGLYLGGSGCHPGGGITCAAGFLAAKVIAKSV